MTDALPPSGADDEAGDVSGKCAGTDLEAQPARSVEMANDIIQDTGVIRYFLTMATRGSSRSDDSPKK